MSPTGPGTEGVSERNGVPAAIGLALAPFALTVVLVTVAYGVAGPATLAQFPTAVYALANLGVVAALVWWLPAEVRARILPYRRPEARELAVAVGLACLTIVVIDPVATTVAELVGAGDPGTGSLASWLDAAIYATSAIVIAPIVEEVLFRGVALEALRRQFDVLVAIGGSAALFGAIHLLSGGLPGVLAALFGGIGYAWMRIQFENLAGASLAHFLNNVFWVAVTLGVLPDVVPG